MNRLTLMYRWHIKHTIAYVLAAALSGLLGCLAADGIGRISNALQAQEQLHAVEEILTRCLNGAAMQDDDGMLVNCADVRSVKLNLVEGL